MSSGSTDTSADETRLRQRGVTYALRPELLEQPHAYAEASAVTTDIFPHQEHPVVANKGVTKGLAQRLPVGDGELGNALSIEHHERAAVDAQPLERLLAVARRRHFIALGAQVLQDAGREVRIVLHHQHAARGLRRGAHARAAVAAGQVSTKQAP